MEQIIAEIVKQEYTTFRQQVNGNIVLIADCLKKLNEMGVLSYLQELDWLTDGEKEAIITILHG